MDIESIYKILDEAANNHEETFIFIDLRKEPEGSCVGVNISGEKESLITAIQYSFKAEPEFKKYVVEALKRYN